MKKNGIKPIQKQNIIKINKSNVSNFNNFTSSEIFFKTINKNNENLSSTKKNENKNLNNFDKQKNLILNLENTIVNSDISYNKNIDNSSNNNKFFPVKNKLIINEGIKLNSSNKSKKNSSDSIYNENNYTKEISNFIKNYKTPNNCNYEVINSLKKNQNHISSVYKDTENENKSDNILNIENKTEKLIDYLHTKPKEIEITYKPENKINNKINFRNKIKPQEDLLNSKETILLNDNFDLNKNKTVNFDFNINKNNKFSYVSNSSLINLKNSPNSNIMFESMEKINPLALNSIYNNFNTENSSSSKIRNKRNFYKSSTIITRKTQPSITFNEKKSELSYYDKISKICLKKQKGKNFNQTNSSLLTLADHKLDNIISNENFKKLKYISSDEDEFIDSFRKFTDDQLILFSDEIFSIVSNLESSIILIKKLRNYFNFSVEIPDYISTDDLILNILKEADKILDCENAKIFLYDKNSHILSTFTSTGEKNFESQINKNKGLIGEIISKGNIIKINDMQKETRLDFEEEEKYSKEKIRNLIIAPLKDKEGEIFGAIQLENKKISLYSNDDEELFKIFSSNISKILINLQNNNLKNTNLGKLKYVVSLQNNLRIISNIIDFCMEIKKILVSVFSSEYIQILIYNKNTDNLFRISKYELKEINKNIGLVGYVFNKKEYYGINSIKECLYFNSIADLDTGMPLLTYPILNGDKVKGILQLSYNEKLIKFRKPKEIDEMILDFICREFQNWFDRNSDLDYSIFDNAHKKNKFENFFEDVEEKNE